MNLKDTYDTIAIDWHKDHLSDNWWIDGMGKFAGMLPAGATVLDAGCAGGVKSKFLVDRGFQVTGIDFAPNFIEIAKKEVPEAEFQVLDIRDVDSLEKQFDGIVLQAVLLHFPKKEISDILKGITSRLHRGGIIHVSVKELREDLREEGMEQENDYGYEYERFFSYFSQQELEDHLKKSGLSIVSSDIHSTGRSRWIQIIARKDESV